MVRTSPYATKAVKSRQQAPSARVLTPAQLAAVELVVTGKPDAEVAEAVGVTRQTTWGWRHYHPEFRATLNTRRREVFGQASDGLRALLSRSIDVLAAELGTRRVVADGMRILFDPRGLLAALTRAVTGSP